MTNPTQTLTSDHCHMAMMVEAVHGNHRLNAVVAVHPLHDLGDALLWKHAFQIMHEAFPLTALQLLKHIYLHLAMLAQCRSKTSRQRPHLECCQ